jgi:hypothetical protein
MNHFKTCSLCGTLGHRETSCPLRDLYSRQAVRAVSDGSATPELRRLAIELSREKARAAAERLFAKL